MKMLMIAAAAIVMGASAPAMASMARNDTNGDGKVSLQEMQAHRLASTMRLDANHDGRLTKAEYAATMITRFQSKGMDAARAQAKVDRMFAKEDLNHDGVLTADEIKQSTARRFARVDPSRSGYIPATTQHHQGAQAPSYVPAAPASSAPTTPH
jgi:hypothetical protein